MALPLTELTDIQLQLTYLSTPKGWKAELACWLTYSGRFTHINGYLWATGRAQDRESSPAKDRRSTAVPRNQPMDQCNGPAQLKSASFRGDLHPPSMPGSLDLHESTPLIKSACRRVQPFFCPLEYFHDSPEAKHGIQINDAMFKQCLGSEKSGSCNK